MQIGEEAPTAQPDLRPGQIVIKDLDGYVRDENGNPKVDENGRFMLLGRPDGIIDEADTELIGTLDPGLDGKYDQYIQVQRFRPQYHVQRYVRPHHAGPH